MKIKMDNQKLQSQEISKREAKYKNFRQIANNFYNEALQGIHQEETEIKNQGTINIEPYLIYDRFANEIKVEFKIR